MYSFVSNWHAYGKFITKVRHYYRSRMAVSNSDINIYNWLLGQECYYTYNYKNHCAFLIAKPMLNVEGLIPVWAKHAKGITLFTYMLSQYYIGIKLSDLGVIKIMDDEKHCFSTFH